jgi:uncharacterized Tic20 family protein
MGTEAGGEQERATPAAPEPAQPSAPQAAPTTSAFQQANTWAMFAHLASFSAYISGAGLVVGPLVIWLIKKDEFELVDDQGKEAVNFNLSVLIYSLVGVLFALTVIGLIIAIPLWIALFVGHLVFTIIAAVTANQGRRYRYPLTIRLVK